jgi:AraC family transcriptional regulator
MSITTSISRAIEFVENHLVEDITVADIADAVPYSLYHFCRTFNRVTHHSPYDYLMRRRLSESARELVETDRKIIDVAFDYQFGSPEAYSRAFKRMFGMQPTQWKKQGTLDSRFLMSRLTLEHLRHRNRGDYLKPVLREMDAFQVAGVMALVDQDEALISQLWEMLAEEVGGIENALRPASYYGIVCYPQGWERRGFFYMAAVAVGSPRVTAASVVVKTIPGLKYARFVHKGPAKDRRLTLDYIYQTWLPKSGRSLPYSLEIESYGQDLGWSDSEESESQIYIPIE